MNIWIHKQEDSDMKKLQKGQGQGYLCSNSIGVDGAKAIAEALQDNNVLTTINLNKNSVGVNLLNEIEKLVKIAAPA